MKSYVLVSMFSAVMAAHECFNNSQSNKLDDAMQVSVKTSREILI